MFIEATFCETDIRRLKVSIESIIGFNGNQYSTKFYVLGFPHELTAYISEDEFMKLVKEVKNKSLTKRLVECL